MSRSALGLARDDLAAAIAIAAGGLVATGWLVTWARMVNEQLPSDAILTALPNSYFIGVSAASLAPVAIVLALAVAGWVPLCTYMVREEITGWQWRVLWMVFAGTTVLGTWGVILAVDRTAGKPSSGYLIGEIASAGGMALAGLLASVVVSARMPKTPGARQNRSVEGRWKLARPILAGTIVVSVFGVCTARIVDAGFKQFALPIAQIIVDDACATVLNGRPVEASKATQTTPEPRCLLRGFYIGDGDDMAFLAQRRYQCGPSAPPRLLVVPTARIRSRLVQNAEEGLCPTGDG